MLLVVLEAHLRECRDFVYQDFEFRWVGNVCAPVHLTPEDLQYQSPPRRWTSLTYT
ncbi:hypothetical protein AArcCO_1391 [Halalkaliarchaeum sp. AArc-CO]|nr:hypothetical protein AArcCO_1391 [Halalkaliarchaeum sp. AArc-CO]